VFKIDNPNYYAVIPANVRYSKAISPQEKLLYAEISSLSNAKGYCWATNEYFSELYDLSKRTVSRQISNLEKKGFLVIKMIYKANSKQVESRKIYIVQNTEQVHQNSVKNLVEENKNIEENTHTPIDKNVYTPIDKNVYTYRQKCLYPMDKNVYDNNKDLILNNNKDKKIYSSAEPNLVYQIVGHLNLMAGTNYKPSSKSTQNKINARLNEGHSLDDFIVVIDKKCHDWLDSDKEMYLRPETLFGNKFEGYVNQKIIKPLTKNEEAIKRIAEVSIEQGRGLLDGF